MLLASLYRSALKQNACNQNHFRFQCVQIWGCLQSAPLGASLVLRLLSFSASKCQILEQFVFEIWELGVLSLCTSNGIVTE